nr:serine protease inhibitor dipetalogastin-like [Plodia interpunctella]
MDNYYLMNILFFLATTSVVTAVPNCLCYLTASPLCASDGNTYMNECYMNCASPNLYVLYYGECKLHQGNQVDDQNPTESCGCPYIYRPVCGSDWKTYPNECAMRCSAGGQDLHVLYYGECKYWNQMPVKP